MSWSNCNNILIIRPDNMGDIIMMTPALHALKKTFNCRITLLTSSAGSMITPFISCINKTLKYNLPWVKSPDVLNPSDTTGLIKKLKSLHFDGVIISTVYSQNPLPAALLAYQAGIPLRAAWCRENPYDLLTDWIADKEPFSFIQHQVIRELNLVKKLGAKVSDDRLSLQYNKLKCGKSVAKKLSAKGIDYKKPWVIIHPGVSEDKRKYPLELWAQVIKQLQKETAMQLLITGAANELTLAKSICGNANKTAYNVAGLFTVEEFICLIDQAQIIISVNTASIHIAAAVRTPVVALYALTNPQHIPWKTPSAILPFSVPKQLKSNNQVVQYVYEKYDEAYIDYPSPSQVIKSALALLQVSLAKHATQEEMI